MKNVKIISFYSDLPGLNYYEESAKNFLLDCKNNNLNPYIKKLESTNNYRLNCLKKPKFILDTILELKQPVMWLDIDSKIHSNMPDLIKTSNDNSSLIKDSYSSEEYDIGFCFSGYLRNNTVNLNGPPRASPIIFNYNQKAISIISRWVEECQKNIDNGGSFFDHEVLVDFVLPVLNQKILKIKILDQLYCASPNSDPSEFRHITMGIAKHEQKKQGLREMGLTENRIKAEVGE